MSSLDLVLPLLAELRKLGRDDGPAISLAWVVPVVVLVVVLGRVEPREGLDLRHDGVGEDLLLGELLDDLAGDLLLLRRMRVDDTAVLLSHVSALLVHGRRVVD